MRTVGVTVPKFGSVGFELGFLLFGKGVVLQRRVDRRRQKQQVPEAIAVRRSISLANSLESELPRPSLRLRKDVLNRDLILRRFEQIYPVDFFLATG